MVARWVVVLAGVLGSAAAAVAQNPIQWQGNARGAIARAKEQQLPLMFWVSEQRDVGEDDELRDAEEDSFRDPTVVGLAHDLYIPVRITRTSRVNEELERLGLPTSHGLYVALVTPDGEVLDTIGPMEVANPEALSQRLRAGHRTYVSGLYEQEFAPVIRNPSAPKADVREAVRAVWRLKILSADSDIAALLTRSDLTDPERARLYSMLASFATGPSVEALLSAAAEGKKDAVTALARGEAGSLEFLLNELPGPDSAPTPRQAAAYDAAARLARLPNPRPASFWEGATPEERTKAIDLLRRRAEPVLAYWMEREGALR